MLGCQDVSILRFQESEKENYTALIHATMLWVKPVQNSDLYQTLNAPRKPRAA